MGLFFNATASLGHGVVVFFFLLPPLMSSSISHVLFVSLDLFSHYPILYDACYGLHRIRSYWWVHDKKQRRLSGYEGLGTDDDDDAGIMMAGLKHHGMVWSGQAYLYHSPR